MRSKSRATKHAGTFIRTRSGASIHITDKGGLILDGGYGGDDLRLRGISHYDEEKLPKELKNRLHYLQGTGFEVLDGKSQKSAKRWFRWPFRKGRGPKKGKPLILFAGKGRDIALISHPKDPVVEIKRLDNAPSEKELKGQFNPKD